MAEVVQVVMKGPQGPVGPAGVAGPEGPQGVAGPVGPAGGPTHLILPSDYGLAADGVTDDATAFEAMCAAAADEGKEVYLSGVIALSHVNVRDLAGHLTIRCAPGARVIGLPTTQTTAGAGQTTVEVTAFPVPEGGVVVTHISSGGAETVLTEWDDYTLTGSTLDFSAGQSPFGAIAVGASLRIVSGDPILKFEPATAYSHWFQWIGGEIDFSQRGLAGQDASGSGITVWNFEHAKMVGARGIGAADYEAAEANFLADSFWTVLGCLSSETRGNYVRGAGDLAFYITGSADEGFADNGRMHLVTGNHVYRCKNGVSGKRDLRGIIVQGNTFEECYHGVYHGSAANSPLGPRGQVIGNYFIKCARRAIDTRLSEGMVISNNVIRDVGRDLSGDPTVGVCTGIQLQGAKKTIVANNVLYFEDWTPPTNCAGIRVNDDNTQGDVQSDDCKIVGNSIDGFDKGIVELNQGARNVFYDNDIENTVDVDLELPNGRRWHYRKAEEEFRGIGAFPFVGTFTPELFHAGGDATFTPVAGSTSANYRVADGVLHVWGSVQADVSVHVDADKELRVRTLPLPARTLDNYRAVGGVVFFENITIPGAQVVADLPSGQDDLRFRAIVNGTTSVPITSDHVPSGQRVRVTFAVTYEADYATV